MLRVEGEVVRLLEDPDQRIRAYICYGCAVAFGIPTLVATLAIHADFWWGALPAFGFLVVGGAIAACERHTQFDFARKLVLQRRSGRASHAIPFDDLVSVAASAHTVRVRARNSTVEIPRFSLSLLVADEADALHETVAGMRRGRVAVIREGSTPAVHELAPRLEHAVSTHALELVDTTDETLVWQAAEWLARKLDLPLVDACTSPTALRVPEELDLPLGERLARGLQMIDATAAYASSTVPSGASVEQRGSRCTLSWRRDRRSNMLYLAGIMVSLPVLGALGLLYGEGGWLWFWLCTGLGSICLPLLVIASKWHGINRLELSRKRVVVTRGPWGTLLPPLVTDSVEAVRIGGTNEDPLLTVVSDQRVLRLPMDPPLARWAKQHIERHLRSMYEKESKRLAQRGPTE